MDPLEGPLTDNELSLLTRRCTSYEKSLITIAELAMALSVSHVGRRSIQISQLRVVDILCGENEKGELLHALNAQ